MPQRLPATTVQQPPPLTLPPDARIQDNDLPARIARGERLDPGEQGYMVGMMPPPDFGPYLKSITKPISELLDTIFTPTAKGTGLPSRLRFTNWDARKGVMQLHSADAAGKPFEVSPTDLDRLINAGHIDIEQPTGDPQLQQKLKQLLEFDAHTSDPRNPTLGLPRNNPPTAMRKTLDRMPKPTLRTLPKD